MSVYRLSGSGLDSYQQSRLSATLPAQLNAMGRASELINIIRDLIHSVVSTEIQWGPDFAYAYMSIPSRKIQHLRSRIKILFGEDIVLEKTTDELLDEEDELGEDILD